MGHGGFPDRVRELARYEEEFAALQAGIMRRIEADPDAAMADFRAWFESQRTGAGQGQ